MMCKGKFVFPLFTSFLILTAFASVSEAKTIYVPDDYVKIQWAVDNASARDTIIVRDSFYVENIDINKPHLTIKSENGSANCVVKAANSNDHIFYVTADNVTIKGFTVIGAAWKAGVYLHNSNNCRIENVIASNNHNGIRLDYSSNNTIANNTVSNNYYGICLFSSSNNTIANNIVSSNNIGGICLDYSSNTIANNTVSNNHNGIRLWYSNNNTIANNTVSNNIDGIHLLYSSNNTIANNTFLLNGMLVHDSYNNTVTNSTVNGKPLVYLENVNDYVVKDAGQVIAINSNNITIKDLNLSYASVGVEFWKTSNSIIANNTVSSNNIGGIGLWYSSNNTIANNNASNNDDGIYLYYSSNNNIYNNNASNNVYGITLWDSSNNIIYLNNFINNKDQVYSDSSTNIWNSTEKITYTYNGSQHTNYLGNYWSDYKGSDADEDGIGETPYIIDSDKDNYPLIERFENYFVPTPTPTPSQIFDTGRPENPYPSISGEFIGTIKTNTKIIAKKLYTYACEGTGGHTEHALIWNETWCAYAEWEGYKEDWMNISFNRTVVLMPYETYNITIVTGSYPQIHHTSSLKTESGWINCTEFIDANGNKYDDWIPAIMLWS